MASLEEAEAPCRAELAVARATKGMFSFSTDACAVYRLPFVLLHALCVQRPRQSLGFRACARGLNKSHALLRLRPVEGSAARTQHP